MPRLVLALGAVGLFASAAVAGPVPTFDFRVRYDGTTVRLGAGTAEGSLTVTAGTPDGEWATATGSANASLNFVIRGTAPADSPGVLDVATTLFTVSARDAASGVEASRPMALYSTGTAWAGGANVRQSLDVSPLPATDGPFWLGPDHAYRITYDFTPVAATGDGGYEGGVSIRITAEEAVPPPGVPEPSTLVLAGVGLVLPAVRRWRKTTR